MTQEALLRLTRQDDEIDEPAAWMTTVVTRLSINVLNSARARREAYVGPRLSPVERAAYLLREVFGYEYSQIAEIVERTEANCRQLVTRARKHVEASRPRFDADEALRDELLQRFIAAAEEGDVKALEELLAEDAVLYADGGGKAIAAQEPFVGARMIARFMVGVTEVRRFMGEFEERLVRVNGQPGRVLRVPGVRIWEVLSIDVVDGRIQTVRIVRNPDKLAHL